MGRRLWLILALLALLAVTHVTPAFAQGEEEGEEGGGAADRQYAARDNRATEPEEETEGGAVEAEPAVETEGGPEGGAAGEGGEAAETEGGAETEEPAAGEAVEDSGASEGAAETEEPAAGEGGAEERNEENASLPEGTTVTKLEGIPKEVVENVQPGTDAYGEAVGDARPESDEEIEGAKQGKTEEEILQERRGGARVHHEEEGGGGEGEKEPVGSLGNGDDFEEEASKLVTKTSLDDISATGNCSKEIQVFCPKILSGAANLVECIVKRMKIEKSGNDADALAISLDCKSEVRSFRVEMYKDLALNKKMETACRVEIGKFCDDDFLYPEPGNVVACLREVEQVDKVSDTCKEEIDKARLAGAEDIVLDPQLNELCKGEAERLCKGVEPGEGRIQDCLREHRNVLAWDCQAELFRQEVENADDVRLNVRLFRSCLNDKHRFCENIPYGDARVKDCLEEHRLDPNFSPSCKIEFDKMMERRASDFRLDFDLRKYCKGDIAEICYPDAEDISDVANWDAKVIQCLQDYRDELKDARCKSQVHQLTKRAAEDIRFDKPLSDACYADRQSLCKDVPDGMAQVLLCLQDHFNELKDMCRNALFEELVRMAEDIDFKFPMKRSCTQEIDRFCKGVPPGHAAVIHCLQDKVEDANMGEDCKREVKKDMLRSAEDYRLNYRLSKACFNDVQKLCLHACDSALESGSVTCGGNVLKCLQDNTDNLQSDACKQEVFHFTKPEIADITLDVPLQTACRKDLDQLCPGVKTRDHTRTLSCLRRKRDKLSDECKAEELRFSIMEASDIRLTPSLMNSCGQELVSFCRNVPPSEGRAFKCLQSKLSEIGMGAACKAEVNLQEIRQSSNYKLDVGLRKQCEADVGSLCADQAKAQEGQEVGTGLVLKCLVESYRQLQGSCQAEVSYAVRSALWQYKKGAPLTHPCDSAVEELCNSMDAKEVAGAVVGVYGQCLMSQKAGKLAPGCRQLIKLVFKESQHSAIVSPEKLEETLHRIEQLKEQLGEVDVSDHGESSGVMIGGWFAVAGIIAVVVVVIGAGIGLYRKFFGPHRNYTLVVKGAPGAPSAI